MAAELIADVARYLMLLDDVWSYLQCKLFWSACDDKYLCDELTSTIFRLKLVMHYLLLKCQMKIWLDKFKTLSNSLSVLQVRSLPRCFKSINQQLALVNNFLIQGLLLKWWYYYNHLSGLILMMDILHSEKLFSVMGIV